MAANLRHEKGKKDDHESKDKYRDQDLHSVAFDRQKYQDYGQCPIDELGIVEKDQEDLLELKYILGDILHYPSTELAKLHRDSYILGNQDLKEDEDNQQDSFGSQKPKKQTQFCPCCGFIKQENEISIHTEVRDIKNFGVSTYLYFQTVWDLTFILLAIFLLYGVFALVTNIIAAVNYTPEMNADLRFRSNQSILVLSLGSKQLNAQQQQNRNFYYAQCWIGLFVVILWGFSLYYFKYRELTIGEQVQLETKSAADYSIMIHNISTDITQKQLQKQLDQFYHENSHLAKDSVNQLRIVKINLAKPFYLEDKQIENKRLKKLNKKYEAKRQKFKGWITMRMVGEDFPFTLFQRKQQYLRYERIKQQRQQLCEKVIQEIKQEIAEKSKQQTATTTAFVTFQSRQAKQFILSTQFSNFAERIKYYITCCWGTTRFYIQDKNGKRTKAYLEQAPQPEDVNWMNLGQQRSRMISRKIIAFFVTAILLGISFSIVYALSRAQMNEQNFYISFLISLVINLFNFIITQFLKLLTSLQKNHTDTNKQASLAVKAIFAVLINSIVIPITVNYYLKDKNLYGINGLASDVFFISLTNSFISPIVRMINPRTIKNNVIAQWKSKPINKLNLNQDDLNGYHEKIQFRVGYQSVYVINVFIFTAYFVSLQPITPVFAVLGLTLMYWVEKYNIFHRCRRPTPGGTLVNEAIFQIITLAPLIFSLGNLTWSNFFRQGEPKYALIPNLIACGVSLVIFLMPYKKIAQNFYPNKAENREEYFSENRIFLPSEYDRLNPSTSDEAIEEYLQFVKNYKKNLSGKSDKQIRQIQKKFRNQIGRRLRQQKNYLLPGENSQNKYINEKFNRQEKTMNPLLVLDAVLPEKNNEERKPMAIFTQNWKTAAQKVTDKMNKDKPMHNNQNGYQDKIKNLFHRNQCHEKNQNNNKNNMHFSNPFSTRSKKANNSFSELFFKRTLDTHSKSQTDSTKNLRGHGIW